MLIYQVLITMVYAHAQMTFSRETENLIKIVWILLNLIWINLLKEIAHPYLNVELTLRTIKGCLHPKEHDQPSHRAWPPDSISHPLHK